MHIMKSSKERKEVKFIGITRKPENIAHARNCTEIKAFEVEFNSVNSSFEDDFLETLECYKKHGTSLNVTKVKAHRYKVILENSDGNAFGILFRMYMSYRHNLWMEIDTELRFEPILDFTVEFAA